MSEQKEPEVRANVGDGRDILFETKEDCLLFTANTGTWQQFQKYYYKLLGITPTVRQYRERREPEAKIRCIEMMERTLLSDGMTLVEAIKRKAIR